MLQKSEKPYEKHLVIQDFYSEHHEYLQYFVCQFCTGVLNNPVITNEGEIYCKNCNLIACENFKLPNSVKSASFIDQMLGKMKLHCKNKHLGCTWNGFYSEFMFHLQNQCDLAEINCLFDGCCWKNKRIYLKEHILDNFIAHFSILNALIDQFENNFSEKFENFKEILDSKLNVSPLNISKRFFHDDNLNDISTYQKEKFPLNKPRNNYKQKKKIQNSKKFKEQEFSENNDNLYELINIEFENSMNMDSFNKIINKNTKSINKFKKNKINLENNIEKKMNNNIINSYDQNTEIDKCMFKMKQAKTIFKIEKTSKVKEFLNKKRQIKYTELSSSLNKEKIVSQENVNLKFKEDINICSNIITIEEENNFDECHGNQNDNGSGDCAEILNLKNSLDSKNISNGIITNGTMATLITSFKNEHHFVFSNFKINLQCSCEWKVNIVNYSYGWIAVGACIKQQIINNKYKFVSFYKNFIHGTFVISSNGICWNTNVIEEDDLDLYNMPKLIKGQEIIMNYDPTYQTLTFTINEFKKTLTGINCRQGFSIVPCVIFLNAGDSVNFEIL